MYRIIKVLNNNSILVLHEQRKKEYILLGNGIGFGKKTFQKVENISNAKIYSLVTRQKEQSVIKTINSINPLFIEATAKIIDDAEKEFGKINKGILLPLADHISLAIKRAKDNAQLANPLNADIKLMFEREFSIALKAKDNLKSLTGYEISDSEAGFIALHIHAGLTGDQVADTLNITRIINESMAIIEKNFENQISKQSLGYNRLMSYLYYIVARVLKDEEAKLDINDYIINKYPKSSKVAKEVCLYIEKQLKKDLLQDELGFLAIHIEKILTDKNIGNI